MAQNTVPIFPLVPQISWGTNLTTANTAKDGTGTIVTVFTAKAVDGSRLDYLKSRARGTNVATVLRVFINNGSDPTTAANNVLFMERTIPATTVSEIAELADVYIPMDISMPAGYKINVTIGTTVVAGLMVTAIGGEY